MTWLSYYATYNLGPCNKWLHQLFNFFWSIESYHWNALSAGWRQISPKTNGLGVRGHERSLKRHFWAKQFFGDNFWAVWNDRAMILTNMVFASSRRIETCMNMTLKGQGRQFDLRSRSRSENTVTSILHYVGTMRLELRETQWDHSHVSSSFGSKVIRKKRLVTLGDLMMTILEGHRWQTVAWVITEDLSQHHSQWMEMFWCE